MGDGTIAATDERCEREINEVLNLNQGTLTRNRKAVLEAFRQGLIQANPSDADLRKQLAQWNGDNGGDLAPFCQVVVYYLQKKIARMK